MSTCVYVFCTCTKLRVAGAILIFEICSVGKGRKIDVYKYNVYAWNKLFVSVDQI